MVEGRGILQGAEANRIVDDLLDLGGIIAQGAERFRNRLVDDLEVAAAGQLLELDQSEVRLDARRIAIHHQADGAGGGNNRGLRIAVAMGLAQFDRQVPGLAGMENEIPVRAIRFIERHRRNVHRFVTYRRAISGPAMVAHHPQHVVLVLAIAGEGAELLCHFSRGGIGNARHDRRERSADGAALVAVIGNAVGHQQTADIGKAQAERPVLIGELGDFPGGELRHQHADFQNHGPQPHRMLVSLDVKLRRFRIAELQKVERGEIAGRIIKEHVFRAGVGGADVARCRAGVPVIDRGVILDAGISRGPGRMADLVPKVAGLQGLGHLARHAGIEVPGAIGFNRAQERIGDAHGLRLVS